MFYNGRNFNYKFIDRINSKWNWNWDRSCNWNLDCKQAYNSYNGKNRWATKGREAKAIW